MWTDERIIRLASEFVPVADEVFRLQSDADPESRFFQSVADHGHYRQKGGTRQGIYICTPNGKLLGSVNSLDADVVLKLMRNGLTAWRALQQSQRLAAPAERFKPDRRWELNYPEDGLVLTSVSRDLESTDAEFPTRTPFWNRDHVWFTRDEASMWLPEERIVGARHTVPQEIGRRLARLHLVDDVRGQTIPYAPQEVRAAQFNTEILSKDASRLHIRISGHTEAQSDGPWLLQESIWVPEHEHPHGMRTDLLGRAVFDLESQWVVEFELFARGEWFGRTQFNGRKGDDAHGLIGFMFTLAPRRNTSRVPPGFVDSYNASWITRP